MGARYLIRFDDFFSGMDPDSFQKILSILKKHDTPAIIGVTPRWTDHSFDDSAPDSTQPPPIDPQNMGTDSVPGFWSQIKELQKNGTEIALHGDTHTLFRAENLLGVNPYGEFAGLPLEVQIAKLRKGKTILENQGIKCRMFMAPGHSFDLNTLAALRETNIPWITDGKTLYPYLQEGIIHFPQITSDFRSFPLGIITICLHPQYMYPELYAEFENFCRDNRASIISVEQALDQYNRAGPALKTFNRLIRLGYTWGKSIRRRLG